MNRFKKIHRLLTLVSFLACIVFSGPVAAEIPQDHQTVPDLLADQGAGQSHWLFLGDSITYAGHYVDYLETWYLLHEARPPEMIDLGVSSETIANTSEPDHPFQRPWLLNQLDRVLNRVKPNLVFACYGMNDGIYHPFSEDRFRAFQLGVNTLVEKARAIGASIVLLTPPPYAGKTRPRPIPVDGETYSYKRPFADYNGVLETYAEWLLSLDEHDDIRVIDIRPVLETFMEESYPAEPIHPSVFGHQLIAEALLQGLSKTPGNALIEIRINSRDSDPHWASVMRLVSQQREIYDRALLNDIGHGNPYIMRSNTLTLLEAEEQVKPVNAAIEELHHE